MPKSIKAAVIGCGVIAPTHIEAYQALEDVEVAWACDLVEAKAKSLAEKYGIARYTTRLEDVLADSEVNAVSICTDHASHRSVTLAALEAGKHVLCEKALTATPEGLDLMLEAASQHPDLAFGAIFQHRFDESYRYVKHLIETGRFGKVLTAGVQVRCLRTKEYYAADKWRGTWAEEGGAVLINQAIHFIDALAWIMGGVDSLCGTYENLTHEGVIETEDTAVAILRFHSGALGTLEATSSSHINWEPTLSVHGSAGAIELRLSRPLKVDFLDKELEKEIRGTLDSFNDHSAAKAGKTYYGPSHPAQIADFVNAIRDGREPFVTAQSARHTVDIVHAIYRSHRENGWVKLNHRATLMNQSPNPVGLS